MTSHLPDTSYVPTTYLPATYLPAILRERTWFCWEEARRLGVTQRDLDRALLVGECVRIKQGIYSCKAAKDPQEAHRVATEIELLDHPECVASHHSALLAYGLPLARPPRGRVHLTRVGEGVNDERPYVAIHHAVAGATHNGSQIEVAVAITQAATLDPLTGLMAADQALRLRLTDPPRLAFALRALTGYRGIVAAREALRLADIGHESPGESRMALVVHQLGFRLTPQVAVDAGGHTYYLDGLIPDTNVALEYDGRDKYFDPSTTPAQVLDAERRREHRLRSVGLLVIRVTKELLDRPRELERRIVEELANDARRARTFPRAAS